MRSSLIDQIRTLEEQLDNPNPETRLRAATRIFEIGNNSTENSRIRSLSIDVLTQAHTDEVDGHNREQIEDMLNRLENREARSRPLGAVPVRTEQDVVHEPEQSTGRRVLRETILRGLSRMIPISLLTAPGCAVTTNYDDSVMAQELDRVREFTQNLTRNDETTEERVLSVVRWAQTNLPHYGDGYMSDVYGGDGVHEADYMDISIEDVFRERVVGCHLTAFTMITMLRSIDIDAEYVRSEDLGIRPNHGIMYVPELDRYVHGDTVCMRNILPTEIILQERDVLIALKSSDPEALEEFRTHYHCGGHLHREGDSIYLQAVVHAGYEEQELQRLREMFPEFDLRLGEPREDGFGTDLISARVPIRQLDELMH